MKKPLTHFMNKIRLFIVNLQIENSRFKTLVKKNIFFNKFLFYYGVLLLVFTFGLLFIQDVSNSETFVVLGRVLYLLFYLALIFKFYLAIDEFTTIIELYFENGFTPFLMLKTTAVVVKICATCVGGAGAALGGYIYVAGEFSNAPDCTGYVHRHTPLKSLTDYGQNKISYEEMRHGFLNPDEVAQKKADVATAKYQAAEEAAINNKRWFKKK